MSRTNNPKNNGKHLTEENRFYIAEALSNSMTFKNIAQVLGKDPKTIAYEIKTNRIYKEPSPNAMGNKNVCIHRKSCTKTHLCSPEERTRFCKLCKNCSWCNQLCPAFEQELCPTLSAAPYVCNGCLRKTSCRLEKYYYRAISAQRMYKQRLSQTRQGIKLSEEEWVSLDNFITPLIKSGLPLSHIYQVAKDKLPCSQSTLYRYISSGTLSVKNLDMRRVVRYKKRRKKPTPRQNLSRKGRTYSDFLQITHDNPNMQVWEMDLVEGNKGGKVLLTLFSRSTKLMLIFLLNSKTQQEVCYTIDDLEQQCGSKLFTSTFQVILTDNGSEFSDATSIEQSFLNCGMRTRLFYCDPYCPHQKPGIEKNHEFIRYVLPKGSSFDDLSWIETQTLAGHINSIARDSLNGLSPYRAASGEFSPSLLERLYLVEIAPLEINLTPDLLR